MALTKKIHRDRGDEGDILRKISIHFVFFIPYIPCIPVNQKKIMENDYLWDKTGEDKEIERLEGALKQFRYQPTAPPVLPVKILQTEEKPRFSFFNLRFAVASFASLAILLVGLGIWSQFSNDKIEDVADLSKPIVAPIEIPTEPIVEPKIRPTQRIVRVAETKPIQPKSVAIPQPIKIVFRQTKSAPKVKPNKAVLLTPEEKYAYDQLMLALSITGKQLKEVKDKANSVEDSLANKSLK